jgi:DNA-binding transcriptional LysR family regulator
MTRTESVRLQRLNFFSAVAETSSFTTASQLLNVGKGIVSQQVRRLESELGTQLFVRTTRKVAMTETGRRLYEESTPLLRKLNQAVQGVIDREQALEGPLRITATVDYLDTVLASQLSRFAAVHPKLRLDILASDTRLDLIADRIDVAFRIGWLRKSSLRATRLQDFEQYVVATPNYLKLMRPVTHPHDLRGLEWIQLSLLPLPLSFDFRAVTGQRLRVRMESRHSCNSLAALLALVRSGAGVTVMPDFTAGPDIATGRLVRLLPRWTLPRGGVHAVYPSIHSPTPAVRALLDFVKQDRLLPPPAQA